MKFEDAVIVRMSRSDWAKFREFEAEQDGLVSRYRDRDLLGLEERSRAWYAVFELLQKLDPDLFNRAGSGLECATQSIQAAFEKAAKYDKIKEVLS